MAVVTDKIKSMVDFLVKGFEPKETIFEELQSDVDYEYPVENNLALNPEHSSDNKVEKNLYKILDY